MTAIAMKFTTYAAIILALVGVGFGFGYGIASDKYAGKLATADAALEQIDSMSKANIKQQEIKNAELQTAADRSIANIGLYYKRLWANKDSDQRSGNTSGNTNDDGGTPGTIPAGQDQGGSVESTPRHCTKVEEELAYDANMVNIWRAWCEKHNCPVKK